MTFEAQQKSVQDNGSYEGAKIYCFQELEPEQWRFCDTGVGWGGGGYSHIFVIRVCAAGKGMVFEPFTLG